ncbi:envelope integrity protein Cei [Tsukamurella sp. 1534]|uniref:envelope integrity protein Cei n=1 Tax=Tsukamurella sp. 1534 TaxID=1151061 RepID=UPI0002F5A621|nr:envelope integrity protein Cei [Tsukamurella sp. 1534]
MVSQLTGAGRRFDRGGEPFRRRNALPILIVVAVLAVVAIATWARALSAQTEVAAPVSCPPPSAGSSAAPTSATAPAGASQAPARPASARFDVVSPNDLISVRPAPLAATTVRVLNASGQSGRAETTLNKLSDYGYAAPPTGAYGNDALYSKMECQAQIRFGDAGRSAASAVWVIAPCAELVNDGRRDSSVDLTLGTFFTDLEPSTDAQEILRILRSAPADAADGGANPALVSAVHDKPCN